MLKTKEQIAERFARDIATHQMEVRHEDGVYRHVVFKRPDTGCFHFSLITFPGRLVYTGDMGTFVFERTHDMFEFFGHGGFKREPNFGYWHEKLTAVDRNGGSMQHDVDMFRDNLESYETDDLTKEQQESVTEFIETVVGTFSEQGPQIAYRDVYEFELDGHGDFFCDFCERSDCSYSFGYAWACHAIQWGIAQYVAAKSVAAAASA